ncbi:GAF domain-containing protein [Streptomyces lunaelactis]|nr:GAF domain-containing protein [Streptomyces lunaelactis]NUK18346.1 GAF domain-containing protein [Streptomyces lunaelactis]NUK24924.1 GAF domain-containing protein [Streptomyces lunaelactis]NUK36718.1 GAF domain-containing protein [Streptomyces lunaelactis]NUK43769.1 GAF domain-containing protein [Streptomyces lunaelactis]
MGSRWVREAELSDAWVALESGADPAERLAALRRAYDAYLTAGRVERPVRSVVAESWRRSARAHVSPEGTAGVELAADDLGAYRESHPLARVMPLVRELMGAYARDGEHLVAVCDANGRLLWVEGPAATRLQAGRMNFVPGARWAEAAAGTNAPGTAITVDRPVQVFAAEHFRRPVQAWTCAAAPIHDPATGRLLGAVDITGGDRLAHPHSLAFVGAVARAAESQLALLAPPPAAGCVRLSALGRDEALLVADGRKVRLSRRHSEILVVLARRPEGIGGDELLVELYEDESVTPVTLRAELSRLRGLLGPELLRSRPYRLAVAVDADFDTVGRRLASGAVTGALSAYAGPLLPASQAPAVARLRGRLEDQLRAALIARGDPGLLADWAYSPWGEDDLPVWRALASVLPVPQRPAALARVRELDGWQGS